MLLRRLRQSRPRLTATIVVALLLADLVIRTSVVAWGALSARGHLEAAQAIVMRAADGGTGGSTFTADDVVALRSHLHAASRGAGVASSQMLYLRGVAWIGGAVPAIGPSLAHAPALIDMAAFAASGADRAFTALEPAVFAKGEILPRVRLALTDRGDDLEAGLGALHEAARRAEGLRTVPWAGPFAPVRAPLDRVAAARPELQTLRTALPPLRAEFDTLAGFHGPQRILLLGQNDHEIRATGGFIGTIGLVTLDQGRIVAREFAGSESFAPGRPQRPPREFAMYYGAAGWYIRDANWWPDFPTSARAAADFVRRDRGIEVDAVVGIDTTMLGLLISRLGPIRIADVEAPESKRAAAEWRGDHGTIVYPRPGSRDGALLSASAGEGRHAFAYLRPGIVKAGDRVELSTLVRRESARWIAFGDAADVDWHAAFFDLQEARSGRPFGNIDATRIEPAADAGAGWLRVAVTYTVRDTNQVGAWLEVAGGDGATGGFNATGAETVRFDAITVRVNGQPLAGACGEGDADATWSAVRGGAPCPRPLAFPEPLSGDNWLHELETNFIAAPVEGRKQAFLAPIVEALLDRTQDASPADAVGLLRAVDQGARGRHLQVYHRDPEVQDALVTLRLDGGLRHPEGAEMLAVIDANISESKVQPAITRDVTYLRGVHGEVDLTIRWTNRLSEIPVDRFQRLSSSGVRFDPARQTWTRVPGIYGAYVRIVVPPNTTFSRISGFTFPPGIHVEEGLTVLSGFIRVADAESQRVVLSYRPGGDTPPASSLYVWKQGGNAAGEWRILQNVGEQQHVLFEGQLTQDVHVPVRRAAPGR